MVMSLLPRFAAVLRIITHLSSMIHDTAAGLKGLVRVKTENRVSWKRLKADKLKRALLP